MIVLPPPPRKPTGKATVKKYVQFLEAHLLEDLKEKVYYSIEDINRDTRAKIAAINNTKKTPESVSKMEAFLQYDKPQMKPLAGESFSLCDYKYFAIPLFYPPTLLFRRFPHGALYFLLTSILPVFSWHPMHCKVFFGSATVFLRFILHSPGGN